MEKKKRKNRKPLIVVAMLLMVALVVGMGAMTYSRYVSSFNPGAQTATAAKWGFVVNANANSLFGTQYGEDNADSKATVDETGNIVVSASSKTVAPGTNGSMTISINGTAEVRAKLTFTATVTSEILLKTTALGGTEYRPIVWTLKDGETTLKTGTDLEDVLSGFAGATIEAGDPLTNNYVLSWDWAWSEDEAISIKDTIIGVKAANATWSDAVGATLLADGTALSTKITSAEYANVANVQPTLAFSITVKLEQIQ